MAALLPFLATPWRWSWSTAVMCTDASETGYGAVWRRSGAQDVQDIGRVPERGRFHRREGGSAREEFFLANGFFQDELGKWVPGDAPSAREDWVVDTSFPEVPSELYE